MVARLSLSNTDSGQILVTKTALDGDLADRRAEAEWLDRARHPGVVELISFTSDPPTIVTAHAGAQTLRTRRPTPPEAAAVLLQVGTTLSELHARHLTHGKISLDHICLDGPVARLCSPSGTDATGPGGNRYEADLIALARSMTALMNQWASDGVKVENEAAWADLIDRLNQHKGPFGARRSIGPLAALSASPGGPAVTAPRKHRWASATLVGGFASLALVGLVIRPSGSDPAGGVELAAGGYRFVTASNTDTAAATSVPGPGTPPGAVLVHEDTTVWAFYDLADGQEGERLASVPGATGLEYRRDGDCYRLWATGPAGQVILDRP